MDICVARKDPARFIGQTVKGQMAIVPASPHGAYFESRCGGDGAGFLFLKNDDPTSKQALAASMFEAARPPRAGEPERTVEALVTGVVASTGRGGWGLNVVKFDNIRLIPVTGSGYVGLEALEVSLKSVSQPK